MSFWDIAEKIANSVVKEMKEKHNSSPTIGDLRSNIISYGQNTVDDNHDHRYNTGGDRTPAQKEGDKKRKKNNYV